MLMFAGGIAVGKTRALQCLNEIKGEMWEVRAEPLKEWENFDLGAGHAPVNLLRAFYDHQGPDTFRQLQASLQLKCVVLKRGF
jgi:hypothetical protein